MAVIPFRIEADLQGHRRAASEAGAAELLAKIAVGEVWALESLMSAFWGPLTAYASRLLRDSDLADDAIQEVFVRVWARRAEWHVASVRALLFTLARNAALDEIRRGKSRARLVAGIRLEGTPLARTPAELMDGEDLHDAVDQVLQQLPQRRREVFDLVYLRGLSYREAAEVMRISPKTVGNQMTAALCHLRQALGPVLARLTAE